MATVTLEYHHRNHRRAPPVLTQTISPRKLVFFLLKCVIMVLVFSVFLFFLGFAAVVLLHFLIMSNTFHRRSNRFLHPTNTHAQSAVSSSSTAYALPRLPNVIYGAKAFPRTADCAICLEQFIEGDACKNLPACNHFFHAKCVDRWIGRKPNCPICRTRIDHANGFPGSSCVAGDDCWKRMWAFGLE